MPSPRSRSSQRSYISEPQSVAHGRITGVRYPPMGNCCPVNINIKDSTLIGRSEFYSTTVDHGGLCPVCEGQHKVYRCNTFIHAGLQERWYLILKLGLCLHCLYPKHSSFSCKEPGACFRCGTRHNSLLCSRRLDLQD